MVGAGEQALLRQRVLGESDAHGPAGAGHRLAHRRMLGAEGDDVGEIVEQDRHVEIDDGRDLAARHRVAGEILGAEQAVLLGGDGGEQDRALRPVAATAAIARATSSMVAMPTALSMAPL